MATVAGATPAGAATACVLDSNAVLDWLVFDDPHGRQLGQAVMQGRLRWLLCPPMHDELLDVLARLERLPALLRWAARRRQAEQMVARWATPVETPPALPPALQMRCSDADDQIFLDLALAQRTPWLISRDRALLRLARRLRPWGVQVVTPQHWAEHGGTVCAPPHAGSPHRSRRRRPMNACHPDAASDPAPRRLWPRAGPPVPVPLHDSQANRQLEALAAAHLPAHALMQRAGASVARLALALAPHARRIQVLAGPGNNGGDGFEAAAWLQQRGRPVQVWHLGDPARLPADAAASRQRAREAGAAIAPWSSAAERAVAEAPAEHLLIDALLGRGLTRPAQGDIARAIEAMQRSRAPVLAVDLPSGLPADTGSPPADAPCARAQATLALLSPAPGLFTGQGRDFAGEIWWDDLGVDLQAVASAVRLNDGAAEACYEPRRHAQHKGSFGDVRVVGGAVSMAGAALLAGRAALHAGAGRVYLHLLDAGAARLDGSAPELMFGAAIETTPLDGRCTVLAGCGGGAEVAVVLPGLLARAPRLVLDADALNAVAADAALQAALRRRSAQGLPTLLTPHPLEAARLLAPSRPDVAAVQADRLAAAAELAQRLQAGVLLKGSGTVIASPEGPRWINPSGNAALAVPGSGDVLAGWLAGLWSAQGGWAQAPAQALEGALRAARQAVFRHGLLAEQLHPDARPLPARQLADAIGAQADAARGVA